jgi:hypothetical protein
MTHFIARFAGAIALLLTFYSCVKDTDFDQFDQIILEPVVDLNLVFWEVTADAFNNPNANLPLGTVRDTTEIRFLDDPDTRDSVVRADFLFEFDNTTASAYDIVIDFVTLSGMVTYTTQTTIGPGTLNTPEQQILIQEVFTPDVSNITQAGLIAINATVQGTPPDQGSLQMKSKARFYLEISGQ